MHGLHLPLQGKITSCYLKRLPANTRFWPPEASIIKMRSCRVDVTSQGHVALIKAPLKGFLTWKSVTRIVVQGPETQPNVPAAGAYGFSQGNQQAAN